jgi:hypothetical protein
MGMLYRTNRQRVADALVAWLEWIDLKRHGELQNSRAVGMLLNSLLGKAWNSWRDHHRRCGVARRALGRMRHRRLAAAQAAWWAAVEARREVLAVVAGVVAKMRHGELLRGFNMLRANVRRQADKERADEHFLATKGRQVRV